VIHRMGIERIDHELQALGDAQVRGPKPSWHWAYFDDSLASIYGEEKRSQFLVKANDRHYRSIYVSSRWPAEIRAADLGIPETEGHSEEPELEFPPFERMSPGGLPPPPRMNVTAPRWLTIAAAGQAWRFVVMGNEQMTLVLGMNLADFHSEIDRFRNTFAVATPVALLLLAVGGWLLAAQAIRPVKALTQVAAGVTARGLDQRVRTEDADYEFQALIDVINGMLDRLKKSFRQATRFSADAAHELKTPLTILQGQLQQALQKAPAESAEQQRYAELIEEVQRLKVIVRKLLLLAQADSGEMSLNLKRVNLSEEIATLCQDAEQIGARLRITKNIDPEVFAMADPLLLRQALQNLVSNAVKHNRENGAIDFHLTRQGQKVVFTISNATGPDAQIDPEHLFERFYRGDKAHGREVEGVGLGLSIAREITRAHQGDLVMHELRTDFVSFVLTLPATA
jgi:two-component system, OmpR family, heavy metal sensor histidine kinase CusS